MKKLIYTLLAVSIVFAGCKKEEDDASIVGMWEKDSETIDQQYSYTADGVVQYEMDTMYTVSYADSTNVTAIEITSDYIIDEGDTMPYSISGNSIIVEGEEDNGITFTVTSSSLSIIFSGSYTNTDTTNGSIYIESNNYNSSQNYTRQ